jgi:hypothetical protein
MGDMPARTYKATVTNKWDLDNFWLWSTYEMKKSKEVPGFTGKGWMGFDGSQKKLVWAGVASGGGWISLTATGWEGDKLAFSGDTYGHGQKGKATFTFAKGKTPSEFTLEVGMTDATGKAMPPSTETCKKAGK